MMTTHGMESARADAPAADGAIGRLLGTYASIEATSRDMLEAARDSDWDRFGSLHARCDALIDQVRRLGPAVRMDRSAQRARLRTMLQIVRNEAQIRRIACPWSAKHDGLFSGGLALGLGH